jgi:CDP-diacylglycerol--glycerol-3-phosphate 3-phosphatidyltransferase
MKKNEVPFVNPANILTLFRVLLIPVFLITLFGKSFTSQLASLIIFFTASLSDFFDGFIARKRNLHTRFGVFADPLADKLLVGSAFIAFLFLPSLNIPLWLVAIVLAREVAVTIMRMVAIAGGKDMKTEYSGKIKTFFQMVAIFMILIQQVIARWIFERGYSENPLHNNNFWEPLLGVQGSLLLFYLPTVLVGVTALLSVISMIHYLVKNWDILIHHSATENEP